MVKDIIPDIIEPVVNSISKEIKLKNEKIKGNILQLLSTLGLVAPNETILFLGSLSNDLSSSLKENHNYAITIFVFLTRLLKNLKSTSFADFLPNLKTIMEWVTFGLKNEYYKINIECLNTTFNLIKLLREALGMEDHSAYSAVLYSALIDKFKANDIDQELKLTIIATVGNFILYLGQAMDHKHLEHLLDIYREKMLNDNLRPLVFSWLIKILSYNKGLKNIDAPLSKYIPILLDYTTKNNLHLQYQSLELLLAISKSYSKSLKGFEDSIIKALLSIANDENNQLLWFIYENLLNLFHNVTLDTNLVEKSLSDTIKIINSGKLQGNALGPILGYLEICSRKMEPKKTASYLDLLISQNFNQNQAKAIAILASAAGVDAEILKVMTDKLASKDDAVKKSSLLSIGELYLRNKKSPAGVIPILNKLMDSSNDDLRISISICLGKVGVCDSTLFLEEVNKKLSNETSSFYFVAIKEFLTVIYEGDSTVEASHIKHFFDILSQNSKSSNDSIRSICGECLGMILSKQENCFKDYLDNLNSSDPLVRSTFLIGLKLIPEHTKMSNEALDAITESLFKGLVDSDLNSKKNAFNSLQNFAHNHPEYIRRRFADLFNIFKAEHKINPSLIDVVDIGGGLKIKNDKALPIRKAIYSSIKILLEKIPEKFNESETIYLALEGLSNL